MSDALVVVPTFLRAPADLEVTLETLESVRRTEPAVAIQVVDDCSPATALVDALETHCDRLMFALDRRPENLGFSATVNRGLEIARNSGWDAVLLNADIECQTPNWISIMQAQLDTQGRPASVVGALLLYPIGLIQHAGVYVSFLTRSFDHKYRYGPGNLPEAQRPCLCPVTGAFQFIRHECLENVGLYPGQYKMGFEDVSYCLRVFNSGRECIYQPAVKAVHHESLFRGRADEKLSEWQNDAFRLLMEEHISTNLAPYMLEIT